MEASKLNRDEVQYELALRGVSSCADLTVMRAHLKALLTLEELDESLRYPPCTLNPLMELNVGKTKAAELSHAIASYDPREHKTKSTFKRLQSRLSHLLARVKRIESTIPQSTIVDVGEEVEDLDPPFHEQRTVLIAQVAALVPLLEGKDVLQEAPEGPLQMSLHHSRINPHPGPANSDSEEELATRFAGLQSTPQRETVRYSRGQSVPVYKWNLKFTGNVKEMSVSSFLAAVSDLSLARHVGANELFDSAMDLFSGKALIWYKAARRSAKNWEELTTMLKNDFQPANYEEELFDEIRHRTQGVDECISVYMAIMSEMFSRMPVVIDESIQLKILLRNIHPYFQTHLGLVDVSSLDHLKELCRKLEAQREAAEQFVPPSKRQFVLEPDLCYVSASESSSRPSSGDARQNIRRCFRCQNLGHIAVNCPLSSKVHCFKCKLEGYRTYNCPKCSKNSGNGQDRR